MKALVTGSSGFIGSHLCSELLSRGYEVRAFHRASSALRLLDGLEVEHFLGDLTQPETIQAAAEGVDFVFHAAAWMGEHGTVGQQYAVTVVGTRNLLRAARQAGVRRVVHTSSVAALGIPHRNGQQPALIDELHTWNYHPAYYPYGYAKYLAELEVQKAVGLGLDVVIVNPTVVFGPGDIYRQSKSTVIQVAERRLTVGTEGGINCVHISDVIDGHLAALAGGKTGERYILGGENLTYLQLLQLIAGVTGVPAPKTVMPAWLLRSFVAPARVLRSFIDLPFPTELLRLAGIYFFYDLKKAASELGLTSHRPVEDALREAYAWFTQKQAPPESPAE